MTDTFIVGDVHGHPQALTALLHRGGLVDAAGAWAGGKTHLWLAGDFLDRGPDGIGVIRAVRRWQQQAQTVGGFVQGLIGNHELLFLAAYTLRHHRQNLTRQWRQRGGMDSDMASITEDEIAWLRSLPAMARVGDYLLMHSDTTAYLDYGASVKQVNAEVRGMMRSDDLQDWEWIIRDFSGRMAFARGQGSARAQKLLSVFGGKTIVHGHTPIQHLSDVINPIEAFIYAEDHCVAIDGGMYLGAPGVLHRLG